MSLSTFAFVLAVVELVIGVPLMLSPGKATDRVLEITGDGPLYRTIGAFFLVICVLVLSQGTSVDNDTAGVLRLMAWLGAIKSLVICWWPGAYAQLTERVLAESTAQRLFGITATVAGVLFALAGIALR